MNDDLSYIGHFNLVARPFDDICDRRFIWLGGKQLENLAYLKVGVEERKGILLLIGEEGSGKSVLVDRLLPIIAGDLRTVFIRHTGLEPSQLFEVLIEDLGLDKSIATKSDFLSHFRAFLKSVHSDGKKVLLIVENAECQGDEILELLRLFSNFEQDGKKLLCIILVGTDKLVERIERDSSAGKKFFVRGLVITIVLAVLLLAAGVLRMDLEQEGPPVEPQPFVPVHIYFDPGSADLPANASTDLDRVADYLSRAPGEHIAIKGYSDSRGTPSQNVKISKVRAEAAKAYLVSKGVDAAKIQAVGLGSEPSASAGASSESQKHNRRVEIELVTAGAK